VYCESVVITLHQLLTMTKAKTDYRISITLRAEQYNKLSAQAKADHVPMALLIRQAVDAKYAQRPAKETAR